MANRVIPAEKVSLVIIGLLVASTCINVGLAVQRSRAQAVGGHNALPVGQIAPTLHLTSYTGRLEALVFGKQSLPVLLYWFSPGCGWCEVNLPNFMALQAQSLGRYRFVAVSDAAPEELRDYTQRFQIPFEVYNISPEDAERCGLEGTPTSLVISSTGRLFKRWEGAYSPSMLTEIEKSLGVQLPGFSVAAEPHRL